MNEKPDPNLDKAMERGAAAIGLVNPTPNAGIDNAKIAADTRPINLQHPVSRNSVLNILSEQKRHADTKVASLTAQKKTIENQIAEAVHIARMCNNMISQLLHDSTNVASGDAQTGLSSEHPSLWKTSTY